MIRVTHWSEPGGHPDNQDAFGVGSHPLDAQWQLCVVADGQGGQPGGAEAAQLACRTFLAEAGRLPTKKLLRSSTWLTLLRQVDEAVAGDRDAGFTTLVALVATPHVVVGAASGDSAALVLRGDRPAEILTFRQVKNPPVGSGRAVFMPFTSALSRPWTVLAVTDGVWKYAGWEALLNTGAGEPAQEVIDRLRGRATLPGSGGLQDDFTVVLLQADDSV
jgi:hypothetical protein